MSIDDEKELVALKRVGAVVAEARDTMASHVAPGVTTAELDEVGRDVLRRHGARSAPQVAYGFPGVTCISVNDELAHGIPSTRLLRVGDLVNIDVSAELDGYWADTGASFAVGAVSAQAQKLLRTTRPALEAAPSCTTGSSSRSSRSSRWARRRWWRKTTAGRCVPATAASARSSSTR